MPVEVLPVFSLGAELINSILKQKNDSLASLSWGSWQGLAFNRLAVGFKKEATEMASHSILERSFRNKGKEWSSLLREQKTRC